MNEPANSEVPRAKSRRVKRKKVQASDGWTIVTHGENIGEISAKDDEGLLQEARITKTVDGLTVPKLQDLFSVMTGRWKETACAKEVEEMMRKRRWNLREALCIGIGSFSLDWEHRHRSMWQLVLFLGVVDMGTRCHYASVQSAELMVSLVSTDGTTIELYAQEPIFTPLDEAFLAALNITVLPSSIESHITSASFVFAPFVDWDLLLSVFLKEKDPALYIGNDMLDDYSLYANTEKKKQILEECNELGKNFLEKRSGFKVPEFGLHAHALNGLMVYWKKAESTEDD
jgi:hypothetical protein